MDPYFGDDDHDETETGEDGTESAEAIMAERSPERPTLPATDTRRIAAAVAKLSSTDTVALDTIVSLEELSRYYGDIDETVARRTQDVAAAVRVLVAELAIAPGRTLIRVLERITDPERRLRALDETMHLLSDYRPQVLALLDTQTEPTDAEFGVLLDVLAIAMTGAPVPFRWDDEHA